MSFNYRMSYDDFPGRRPPVGNVGDAPSGHRVSLPPPHAAMNYSTGYDRQYISTREGPGFAALPSYTPTSSLAGPARPRYGAPDSIFLSQLHPSGVHEPYEPPQDQLSPYLSGPTPAQRSYDPSPAPLTLRSNHTDLLVPRPEQSPEVSSVDISDHDHQFRSFRPVNRPAHFAERRPHPVSDPDAMEHPHIAALRRDNAGEQSVPQPSSSASWRSDPQSSPTVQAVARRQSFVHRPQAISPPATLTAPRAAEHPNTFRTENHAPAVAHGIQLVSPAETLPDRFRAIFPYELFNAVQSKCFSSVYETDRNLVVSAPTGSGKTVILELAICKLASARASQNFKIIYQAPTKALCSERATDWDKKFSHMGLSVAELTGDTSAFELRRVSKASIVVTTPEKWDSVTRKWQDHRKLLELVELFLIDEVHILKETRGATLEAVVSRMKTIGANIRFVALSATVPNSEDIAKWLGRDHKNQEMPAHREVFGDDLRPVRLKKIVCGYECNGNDFIFDKFLDAKLPGVIAKHAQKKPMLIFCFTRKSCEATAAKLADSWMADSTANKLWPAPTSRIAVISQALQETVRSGVAFHHAGLDPADRQAVQTNFMSGQLHVICCTSTLAVGVNLPCHTVILKGTAGFQDGGQVKELSDLEVMQMLGRAGRPQFDDSALAIILTRNRNKEKYEQMVTGEEILESTLHLNLIEHLNSEIFLGTITSLETAKEWLRGTFLSIRLRRNPAHYKLTANTRGTEHIEAKLEEICERDISMLQENQLVTGGSSFKWTNYGRAMSTYMVPFKTMCLILGLGKGPKMEELINTLAKADEFNEFRFQPDERAFFRQLNSSPFILYPIRETVTQTWHKVSLIIQTCLGGVDLANEQPAQRRRMVAERKAVFDYMKRFVRCFVDCKGADNDGAGMRVGLELTRSLIAEAWEGRPTQLLQITGIGPVAMRKFVSHDIRNVLQLAESDSATIERIMSRNPPYGTKLRDDLSKFPRLTLNAKIVGQRLLQEGSPGRIAVNINAELGLVSPIQGSKWCSKQPCVTLMAETADGILAYFWRGTIKHVEQRKCHEHRFSANLNGSADIVCHFSCDGIVGTIVSTSLKYDGPWIERLAQPIEIHQAEDEFDGDSTEFPDVDELLASGGPQASQYEDEEAEETGEAEPIRLPNGNWQCSHQCTGGALTKAGKKCTHRCCIEGVKRKKTKPKAMKPATENDKSQIAPPLSPIRQHFQVVKGSLTSSPQRKRKAGPVAGPSATPAAPKRRRPQNRDDGFYEDFGFESGLECIDLTGIDDVGKSQPHGPSPGLPPALDKNLPSLLSEDSFDDIFKDLPGDPILTPKTWIPTPNQLTPFKPGASDEILYEGIGSGFLDNEPRALSHSPKQAEGAVEQIPRHTPDSNNEDEFHDLGESVGSQELVPPTGTSEPA